MTGIRTVILVSLAGSVSFTFLLLACALPQYNVWWPLFMLIFYIIAPIPLLVAKNFQESPSLGDVSVFLTTIIIVSAYALPILFARAPKENPLILWGACGLTLSANTLMFATIFFLVYLVVKSDDFEQ